MSVRVSASRIVEVSADRAFDAITDVSRLPEWNDVITAVVQRPDHLDIGAQWIVEMHALGQTWRSRSEVEALDRVRRRFAYRSVTDDGNPSFVRWAWSVDPHPHGAVVTVAGELHPRTFWRRVLLVRIRSRQLAQELTRSLVALEAAAGRPTECMAHTNTGDDR